jgi:hypothetical protein
MTVHKKIYDVQQLLGLLDAAEKANAREAVNALSQHWRKLGLGITLKAHVMEYHLCTFNDKYGIGDKEESFVEQGHQVGAKENLRYAWLTNFEKKSASIINARLQASHPLVTKQRIEALQATKKTREIPDMCHRQV